MYQCSFSERYSRIRVPSGAGRRAVAEYDRPDDVILEKTRNGAYLKVTAVHVVTGTEATAVGPAAEPKAVERLAVTKLQRLLSRA